MSNIDPDRPKASHAQTVRTLLSVCREQWPMELELIAWKAKVTKARYDALRREGFSLSEALMLCTKAAEL